MSLSIVAQTVADEPQLMAEQQNLEMVSVCDAATRRDLV